jgi:hypothetical protein
MKTILFSAICCVLLACADDNPNAQWVASTPKVTGQVVEVALFEYDSTDIFIHPTEVLNFFFIIETQNQTSKTVTLCNVDLQKEKPHHYPCDTFLHDCLRTDTSVCMLYLDGKVVSIPPFSKRLDTILVGGYAIPAASTPNYYADIAWQMKQVNRYKKGDDVMWLYLPRPTPYYQDTIFYPFAKEIKYTKHWHGLGYQPVGWIRSL